MKKLQFHLTPLELLISIIYMVIVIIFLSINEAILSIVVPIIFSQLIPKAYTLSQNRYSSVMKGTAPLKTDKEKMNEDALLYVLYALYLSLIFGRFFYNKSIIFFYSSYVNANRYEIGYSIGIGLFFTALLFITITTIFSRIANKYYTINENVVNSAKKKKSTKI